MSANELPRMQRRHYAALLLLLLGYTLLATAYAVETPLFEAPDESSHLQVIRYIARYFRDTPASRRSATAIPGGLPWMPPYQMPARRADSGPNMAWAAGFHDPPLYYAPPLYHTLAALMTPSTGGEALMADLPELLTPSPSWEAGYAPVRGSDGWNKNIFVHTPRETLAGSATVRATALLRTVSILLGAVTLLCTFALARQLRPDRPWWGVGAALLVAVNPQFIAGNTGVSNDPLTIAICSAALLGMVALLRRRARWPRWALLGVLVGLGIATKQSALLLVPVCGLAALLSAFEGRPLSKDTGLAALGRGLAFALPVGMIGAPWYLSNLFRHGDLLGTAPHYAAQVPLTRFGWAALLATLESYWGAFGWALITLPGWAYALAAAGALIGLAGLVRSVLADGDLAARSGAVDSTTRWSSALLLVAVALNVYSFTGWAKATGAPYGRLLFPTIAPTGVLLALGLAQWRGRAYRIGLAILGLALIAVAALVPWFSLRPAFRTPYRVDGVSAAAREIENAVFNDDPDSGVVSLLGYEITSKGGADATLAPEDSLSLTLYWAAETAPGELLTAWTQLGGIDPEARIADDTRWLGGTLYPSSHWRSGDVVAHEISLEIPEWAPGPSLYWVRVGLQNGAGQTLALTRGGDDYVVLGPWRLRKPEAEFAADMIEVNVSLGEAIHLAGYEIDVGPETVDVRLTWGAQAVPDADYTVFVHLVDDTGDLLAQRDGPPAGGSYPTSWWLPGDIIEDRHTVALPATHASSATLYVGMYNASTGARLPAVADEAMSGHAGRFPDDAISLTRIER